MRKAAFAGLFACACIFAYSPSANAEAFDLFNKENDFQNTMATSELELIDPIDIAAVKEKQEPVKPVKPKVITHKVVEGESLDSIARLYNTTWKRLYDKNESIESPDVIIVGDTVTIPNKDEKLKERVLPQVQAEQTEVAPVSEQNTGPSTPARQPVEPTPAVSRPAPRLNVSRGGSAGNTYTPGQCTWHVKNMRGSSLPNGLGNANQWYYRAQAMGLSTGSAPRVGAAAVRKYGNHVAYVTAVHGNGTITVSEMNYNWTPYATRTIEKPANDYWYIY